MKKKLPKKQNRSQKIENAKLAKVGGGKRKLGRAGGRRARALGARMERAL